MRLRLAGLLVLLTLTVLSAGAQQQPSPLDTPIFRSAVDAIELDAFVFDAQGNPVTDLTENDFEIIEDGQLQEIASFAMDLLDMGGVVMDKDVAPLRAAFQESLLTSPGGRIAAGTDEILRNIIAERVLGLPQDVRVDRDLPFDELPTGTR